MRMVRRVFRLPADDAKWLDEEARRTRSGVPGLLREYVRLQRLKQNGVVAQTGYEAKLVAMRPGLHQAILDGSWSLRHEAHAAQGRREPLGHHGRP